MKLLIFTLCLMLGATAGWAGKSDRSPHAGHQSFSDAEHWAEVFEDESRDEWQQPRLVVNMLGLRPGDAVADIGAGTGYFTARLAAQVGSDGKVYAVETEQAMLDYIRGRADMNQNRVETVLVRPNDPGLPAGEIDAVLIVNTWHHIKGRKKYIGRLAKCLSSGGRVVIVDWREGELPMGPPAGTKISRAKAVEEFEQAGWTLDGESVALPYQYHLIFYPPTD